MSGPGRPASRRRLYLAAGLLAINATLITLNLAKQDLLPVSLGVFEAGPDEASASDPSVASGPSTDTSVASTVDSAGGTQTAPPPSGPAVVTTPTTAPGATASTVDDWPGGRGPVPAGPPVVRRAILTNDGRLQLTGSAPDWATVSKIVRFAAEKLPDGEAQIDNAITWHPDASSDPQWGEVALDPAATFEASSATITPGSTTGLDLVARILVDHPTVFAVVIGHADASGDEQANVTLTAARADAVLAYLAGAGVNPGQMVEAAAGQDDPLADNATVEGREANRRVEITLKNFLIADPTLGGEG